MTRTYQQASRRRTARIDPLLVTLAIFIASAALVALAAWFVLGAFLSMGTYIQTVLP